ncbi:MAG: hypothetical protein ABSG89_01785 [Bacteroidales bacterium]|jgi:hypothetical protein
MKKVLFIFLITIAIIGCKKTKFSPEGPTDIRVRNLQNEYTLQNVIVKTAGGRDTTGNIKNLGSIPPDTVSAYKRFAIAFAKAEISAEINGDTFSTGAINSTYMNYMGQMKITYEVYISNMADKQLTIYQVIPEGDLDSL